MVGDKQAIPLLREMASSPNPFLRPRAVEGLAMLDPIGHQSLFIEFLRDNNMSVRGAAVEALAPFVSQGEVYRALQQAYTDEVSERLRQRLRDLLALQATG